MDIKVKWYYQDRQARSARELDLDQFIACQRALESIGLVPLLPVSAAGVFQFRRDYIEKRNMVAWNFYNPRVPLEVVDIIVTHNQADLESVTMRRGKDRIKVLALQDLIAMKNASGTQQDLEDVKALEDLPPP